MDALCRWDYQAASQYCTWKLLETTWKCFVSFWMASAIESLSLLSSLSRCNQNWTHTIMHHAFKTWCIVSTNGRYAILFSPYSRYFGHRKSRLPLFQNRSSAMPTGNTPCIGQNQEKRKRQYIAFTRKHNKTAQLLLGIICFAVNLP